MLASGTGIACDGLSDPQPCARTQLNVGDNNRDSRLLGAGPGGCHSFKSAEEADAESTNQPTDGMKTGSLNNGSVRLRFSLDLLVSTATDTTCDLDPIPDHGRHHRPFANVQDFPATEQGFNSETVWTASATDSAGQDSSSDGRGITERQRQTTVAERVVLQHCGSAPIFGWWRKGRTENGPDHKQPAETGQ